MDPDDMPCPLIWTPELLFTVVALDEPILVKLQVFSEKVFSLKTRFAVLLSAEEWFHDMHSSMILDGLSIDCLISAQCTRVLIITDAVSLVSRIGAWLKPFAALRTSDDLVELEMTVQGFLIFDSKAATVTPGLVIIIVVVVVTGPVAIIITGTAGVSALIWWRDWMLEIVGGGNYDSSYFHSLLQ